ncbi:hypothetical protein MBLNU230_g5761t1 [Neophaeotheca triangularis]
MAALPTDVQAKYLHTTLYIANKTARETVRTRFNARMKNGSAVVWYDASLEAFCLTCPSSLGPQADVTLGQVLASYLEGEVRDADREGRTPNVWRFGESSVQGLESGEQPAASVGEEEVGVMPVPKVMHRIILQGAISVRFFQLRELPGELLRRTLVSFAEKGHTSRFSLRAVRAERVGGGHLFNGSFGVPLPQGPGDDQGENGAGHPIPLYLNLAMPAITATAKVVRTESQDQTASWKHSTEKPRILDWVRGLGESMPEATETATQAPSDALRMMAKPAEQMATGGRARVVKGGASAEDNESEEDSDRTPKKATGFGELMGRKTKIRKGSDSGSDATSEKSDTTELAPFHSLFARKDAAITPAVTPAVANDPKDKSTQHASDAGQPSSATTMPGLNRSAMGQSNSDSQSAPYNIKAFSKVDRIGLTADPAAQAKWDIDNYRPKGSRRARRSTAKGSTIVSMSQASMTGAESGLDEIPSALPVEPEDINDYKQTKFNTKAWENNVAHLRPIAEGGLIDVGTDTTQVPAITSPTAFPTPAQAHGVKRASTAVSNAAAHTQPSSSRANTRAVPTSSRARSALPSVANAQTATPAQVPPSNPATSAGQAGQLIDYSENSAPQASSSQPASTNSMLLSGLQTEPPDATRPSQIVQRTQSLLDYEDQIDERLQAPLSEVGKKKTMGQQAGRKPKGGSKPGNKQRGLPKVELPLPDAPPPPPPKAPKKAQAPENVPSTGQQATPPPMPLVLPRVVPANRNIKYMLMQDLKASEDDRIEVQFGIILDREPAGKAQKDVGYSEIEANLTAASNSTLNARLSTTPFDVNHIIDLGRQFSDKISNESMTIVAESIKAQELYEVHVLTNLGNHIIYNIDMTNDRIIKPAASTSELYIHYPVRVWDARISVQQEQEQNTDTMRKFYVSLKPDSDARKEGLTTFSTLRQDDLTIGEVFHKRTYTLTILPGLELKVTECRKLLAHATDFAPGTVRFVDEEEGTMVMAQRRWWEASVSTTVGEAEKLDGAEGLLQHLLNGMDGVGWYNYGPRGVKAVRKEAASSVQTNRFW